MDESPYVLKVHKQQIANGLDTIMGYDAVLNISLVYTRCEDEPDYYSQGKRVADLLINHLPGKTIEGMMSRLTKEVTPVEVEEVMDEDDFVQAGIVAREVLKKTAMESAQEWIDKHPKWVDSYSDFVSKKSSEE